MLFSEGVMASTDDIAVSVNGVNISEAEVQKTINIQIAGNSFHRKMTPEKREQFRKSAIDLLVEKELLYQEAKRLGFSIKKSELKEALNKNMESLKFKSKRNFYKALEKAGLDEDTYNALLERELLIRKVLKQEVEDKATLSEGDMKKYYEENRKRFVAPEEVRLREIFIRVPSTVTAEEKKEIRKKTEEIHKRAVAGEDFSKLAMEFSEDKYKDGGGDTGYLHLNMLEAEVGNEIGGLKPDGISGIIESIYGCYIFKLEDKQPERQLSYEEIKERLMKELPGEKLKDVKEAFVSGLKVKAKIEIWPAKELQ